MIKYFEPDIQIGEVMEVLKVLRSGHLTTGGVARHVEEELRKNSYYRYALLTNSGTSAIHLALLGCGIGPGDEVITPSYTYPSVIQCILHTGATPVFCDINPNTLLMDEAKIAIKITLKTKAIMPCFFAGNFVNFPEIWEIIPQNIKLIMDCSHLFPTTKISAWERWHNVIRVHSFYANKNITSGEGGAIFLNDKKMKEKIYKLRYCGKNKYIGYNYEIEEIGYKYNMSDILAAMLKEQIKKQDKYKWTREQIAGMYDGFLKQNIVKISDNHLYPYICACERQKKRIIQKFKEESIGYSHHYKIFYGKEETPISCDISLREISLPIYPKLEHKSVKHISQIIREVTG